MSDGSLPFSADEPPLFPYEILGAGFGNAHVTLRELERNKDEYALLNEATDVIHPEIETIIASDVETVLQSDNVIADEEHVDAIWLACTF